MADLPAQGPGPHNPSTFDAGACQQATAQGGNLLMLFPELFLHIRNRRR